VVEARHDEASVVARLDERDQVEDLEHGSPLAV
jgi:hypothetical protein